jgi:hypothetical protein
LAPGSEPRGGIESESKQALRLAFLAFYPALAAFTMAIAVGNYYPR